MASILVIDDDVQFRATLVTILTEAKYQVVDVGTGAAGLKACRAFHPEIVITDILMPEREGIEIILHLRRDMPEIKIIAISGGGCISTPDFLPIARKLGADLALRKPFRANEILAAVNGLLSDARKSRAPAT